MNWILPLTKICCVWQTQMQRFFGSLDLTPCFPEKCSRITWIKQFLQDWFISFFHQILLYCEKGLKFGPIDVTFLPHLFCNQSFGSEVDSFSHDCSKSKAND